MDSFHKWSPFLAKDLDLTLRYSLEGVDRVVGARIHWEGNQGKDVGYQEIVRLDTTGAVGLRCVIKKPFKANPTFDYEIRSTGSETKVIQKFELKSELADAFFLWLFGVEKEMDATNELGLTLLKKAAEKVE